MHLLIYIFKIIDYRSIRLALKKEIWMFQKIRQWLERACRIWKKSPMKIYHSQKTAQLVHGVKYRELADFSHLCLCVVYAVRLSR